MRCEECRATGLIHCSDPENCGGPWSKKAEQKVVEWDIDPAKGCDVQDGECEACS